MTAIFRPVEGGYTLVVLDEDGVPIPDQDTDLVYPSERACRKAAKRLAKRWRKVRALQDAEWKSEEV